MITSQVCSGQDRNVLLQVTDTHYVTEVFVVLNSFLHQTQCSVALLAHCLFHFCTVYVLLSFMHLMFSIRKKPSLILLHQVCTNNYFLCCTCCSVQGLNIKNESVKVTNFILNKVILVKKSVSCFSAKGKRVQPPWSPPEGTDVSKLCLYNSLTRTKVQYER